MRLWELVSIDHHSKEARLNKTLCSVETISDLARDIGAAVRLCLKSVSRHKSNIKARVCCASAWPCGCSANSRSETSQRQISPGGPLVSSLWSSSWSFSSSSPSSSHILSCKGDIGESERDTHSLSRLGKRVSVGTSEEIADLCKVASLRILRDS